MKRILCALAATVLIAGCSSDREHILKIYNWSDYLEESLIGEFEQWYEEQTGEPVKIVYQTFDINETMLSKIEKGHEDYDVVCPSDYIIERMIRYDMLLPIERDFGDVPNYIDANTSPYLMARLKELRTGDVDPTKYAVPYMWGTTGFIYNTEYADPQDLKTWDVLRDSKYEGKIFIKDAARDVYSVIIQYLKKDEIAAGTVTREELLGVPSKENVDLVEQYLMQIKDQVAGYEADFGKDQLIQGRGWASLNWSGDGRWARDEAEKVGVSLDYIVPQEGSAIWFDGWVIPKYAKNVKAARYFINYICQTECAIKNCDFVGYSNSCGTPEMLANYVDESCPVQDLSYFFGPQADSVHIDPLLYPTKEDIARCALEHDWGEDSEMLISMWSRVKGSNANALTYLIIAAIIIVLGAAVVLSRRNRRHSSRSRRRR